MILVTGAAGFIGSYITDILIANGYTVLAVDNLSNGTLKNINNKAIFKKGDLKNKKFCEMITKDVEMIFHLAAYPKEGLSLFNPTKTIYENIITSTNLLTSAIKNDVEVFVFTSSMSVYGNQEPPFKEEMEKKPVDPYGISKAAVEDLIISLSSLYGFKYVIIRPHNVYGPRQNFRDPYRNVITIFINRVLHNKPPIIYGDGLQKRAFTYIDDCAPWIIRAAFTKKAYGEIFNIGSEEVITIKELAELVLRLMDSNLEPIYCPSRPKEVKFAFCSSEKAKKILGYKAEIDIKTGIKRTIEWLRSQPKQEFEYKEEFELDKKLPVYWKRKL